MQRIPVTQNKGHWAGSIAIDVRNEQAKQDGLLFIRLSEPLHNKSNPERILKLSSNNSVLDNKELPKIHNLRFAYLIDPNRILLATDISISTYDLNIVELTKWQLSETSVCFKEQLTAFRP